MDISSPQPVYEEAICIRTGLHPVSCMECLSCDVVHLRRRSCSTCGLVYRGVIQGCRSENCPEIARAAAVSGETP